MGHYFLRRLIGVGLVFLITFVIFPAILLVLVFVGNGFKLPFKPPPPPLTMEQVLAELKQPDLFRQLNTLDRLKRMKPDANRRTVVEALKPLLDDQNLILRERALVAFGVWGEPEDAAVVVRVMESASGTTRWTAYDTLAMIKGPVAAEALASKLKDFGDRVIVRNALKALGPDAEPFVRPYLEDGDWMLRVEACEVLKAVGTKDSVPALQKAAGDANPNVAGAARGALQAAARR